MLFPRAFMQIEVQIAFLEFDLSPILFSMTTTVISHMPNLILFEQQVLEKHRIMQVQHLAYSPNLA